MTLRIDYESQSFPRSLGIGSGIFETSWDEIIWAAITIGRPSTYHVFRHGPASFHEAIFRLALTRMAMEEDWNGRLRRSGAFDALDPTEKGMISYFVGMTMCKLFASRLLATPWLLHLDVFRNQLMAQTLGRSRPDLVGESNTGKWCTFECKGRSSAPTTSDKEKAKSQAQRLVSVNNQRCNLNIAAFTFFKSEVLHFYWKDPPANEDEPIKLPKPIDEWRYYYEPALTLALPPDDPTLLHDLRLADVAVTIHPKIQELLVAGQWLQAREAARSLAEELVSNGYQLDGIRVVAGASWSEPRKISSLR